MRMRYQIALGLWVLGILFQIFRTLYFIYLSMGQKTSAALRRHLHQQSRQRGLAIFYHLFGCVPYRCKVCELRFHRPRVE